VDAVPVLLLPLAAILPTWVKERAKQPLEIGSNQNLLKFVAEFPAHPSGEFSFPRAQKRIRLMGNEQISAATWKGDDGASRRLK
jgi:hypothetical protein